MRGDVNKWAPLVDGPYEADGWSVPERYLGAISSSDLIRHESLPVPTVVGYENVSSMLRSKSLEAAGRSTLEAQGIKSGPVLERAGRSVLSLDGMKHRGLRRILTSTLTVDLVNRQASITADTLGRLLGEVRGQPRFDVVDALCRPLPTPVIPSLLGLSEDVASEFDANVSRLMQYLSLSNDVRRDLPLIEQLYARNDYLVVDSIQNSDASSDTLLARLAAIHRSGEFELDDLCVLASDLMMAGTEQLRNQLSLSILLLAEHPEQWNYLTSRESSAKAAATECLRRLPSMAGVPRVVVHPFSFGGLEFEAGDFIGVSTLAANLDGRVFPEPARFDIRRAEREHLAFGSGPHHCVGSGLARSTLQIVIGCLAREVQTMGGASYAWRPGVAQRGLERLVLDVVWR